jgi:hypothetical protein
MAAKDYLICVYSTKIGVPVPILPKVIFCNRKVVVKASRPEDF